LIGIIHGHEQYQFLWPFLCYFNAM